MAEDKIGAAADAAGATGAAAAASGQQQADAGAAKGQGQGQEPHVNHKEFVELAKDYRELKKDYLALKKKVEPEKAGEREKSDKAAAAPSEVQQLRQELALKEVAADQGLSREQRTRLERLYRAEQPDGDIGDWAMKTIAEMGWKASEKKAAAEDARDAQDAAKQQRKQVRTDLGAAGREDGAKIPDDPTQIDPATWQSLGRDGRRQRIDAHKKATGHAGGTWFKPLPSTTK